MAVAKVDTRLGGLQPEAVSSKRIDRNRSLNEGSLASYETFATATLVVLMTISLILVVRARSIAFTFRLVYN